MQVVVEAGHILVGLLVRADQVVVGTVVDLGPVEVQEPTTSEEEEEGVEILLQAQEAKVDLGSSISGILSL
jgi:hypothetical protein